MNILTRTTGFIQRAEATDDTPKDGIDLENFIIPFIASTETSVDSHGSIILQDGLDWETRFRHNPLFGWNHPLGGECNAPSHRRAIGKVMRWEQRDGRTWIWVRFAVNKHPEAREIFEMYVDGDLNACSICLGYPYAEVTRTSPEEEILALPEFARLALTEKRCNFVVTRGVVLEVSGCLAGSNLETLAQRSALFAQMRDTPELDRRMEARERALCTRAQAKMDELDARMVEMTAVTERMNAVATRLERASMTPQERELADLVATVEADPALRALFGANEKTEAS